MIEIRSRVLQVFMILMSIAGFAFSVFSFFCIEDEKYKCIICGVLMGILFLGVSTAHLKYNEEIIVYKLWILKKQINIRGITEINYSGIPELYMLYNSPTIFYLPVLLNKKKMRKLIELIKRINPNVEINVNI